MKAIKSATLGLGAVSILGAALAAPAFAFTVPANRSVEPVTAEVLPIPQEARAELERVGRRLHAAEFASVSNPAAERDYVAARRAYDEGWYQNTIDQARSADAAMNAAPNWIDSTTK
jgi:hypothetical protein